MAPTWQKLFLFCILIVFIVGCFLLNQYLNQMERPAPQTYHCLDGKIVEKLDDCDSQPKLNQSQNNQTGNNQSEQIENITTTEEKSYCKGNISSCQMFITNLELKVHDLVNIERQKNNLSVLQLDPKLSDIARAHSQDMAQSKFFDHINPNGDGPTERGIDRNYTCSKTQGDITYEGIAENLFQNGLYDYKIITPYPGMPVDRYHWITLDKIAKSTVEGWMSSPGHRENILTAVYDREGVGIAIATNYEVYITQDFC